MRRNIYDFMSNYFLLACGFQNKDDRIVGKVNIILTLIFLKTTEKLDNEQGSQ